MSSSLHGERKATVARRGRLPAKLVDYRFGVFEIRPAARQLLIQGQPAALGARAFDILVVLLERAGHLVTKDELLDLVWPGLVVEENNLQVQVSVLRRLLGPDAIATVAGHGYRFIPRLTEVAATPVEPASVAKHNLGARLTSFVGRERELADLRGMLSQHRCVTLTGVGGIGKTRLAVELAATLAHTYQDGVWFVDLAPLSDPGLVIGALASVLGVRAEPDRPLIDALRHFVAKRELLVVLDNCEHLLAACAQLATDLLPAGSRLAFLATSREPLHVTGEAVFPVAPLPTPGSAAAASLEEIREYGATQLFVDRATAASPAFALTTKNAGAVARICRGLEGIPLAVELAAARMRAMSAESIAERLTDRFRLLKSGSVVGLPRQQTLRGAIDWSYELLSPPERALFRCLAVFAGGFVLDAVTRVGAGDDVAPEEIPDLLSNLVDKSLVAFDAQRDRYRMLETVRQYAFERLAASGELSGVRARHLQYYVGLGPWARRELDGRGQTACAARLDAERENLLLAFDYARAAPGGGAAALAMIFDYFIWLTYKDIDLWHRLAVDVLGWPDTQAEDVPRSRALFAASFLAYMHGHSYGDAHALASESVRIARACGDPLVLAEGLYDLGLADIALGRLGDAERHFLEGLDLARGRGDPALTASMSVGLGELYSQRGELERAEPLYLDALAADPDNPLNSALVLGNLARNAIALGLQAKAVAYLRESAAVAEPQTAVEAAQGFLRNAAGLAGLRGEWVRALRLQGVAATHQERQGLGGDFVDAPFFERAIAVAREALGEAASRVAIAEGRTLDIDVAIADALAWLDTLPGDAIRVAER